jgi:lipoprotein-releasing system permease protein
MIGVLKAMGANNVSIRKVFLYVSFFLIGRGMLWGNLIGFTLAFLQQRYHIVSLNPEVYYLTAVPIDLNWFYLLLLNLGALAISMLMLIGPSYLISKIRPAESIRFE